MSKIDRNTLVPIPPEAYTSHKTGEVFIKTSSIYAPEKRYNLDKKHIIGRAVDEKLMYPNTLYREKYPEQYSKHCPETQRIDIPHLSYGLYAAILGLAKKNGLYDAAIECFGPEKANAIMDYAMYSILTKSNVTKDFQITMKQQMLFSDKAHNENWYSSLFKDGITDGQAEIFKRKWAGICNQSGMQICWLAIDGSNDMCASESNILAEEGHPKPGNSGNLIGFMMAVNAENGIPVTWDVYRGGRVDCKEASKQASFLGDYGIKCRGVIMDRGFCDQASLKEVKAAGLEYIVMMKDNTLAYGKIINEHASTIKNNVKYALDKEGFFGITSQKPEKLFQARGSQSAYVHLFYDDKKGCNSRCNLIWNTKKAAKEANIQQKEPNAKYSKYILKSEQDGQYAFDIDNDALQEEVDSRGFSVIASSAPMDANLCDNVYTMRQTSEIEYDHMKSQLGGDVLRVHSTAGWLGKFCVLFISTIIRTEIENACKTMKRDTNSMIRELCLLEMILDGSQHYGTYHSENRRQITLLSLLGVDKSMFEGFADQMNNRLDSPIINPVRELPKSKAKKPGKGGRPKGSKNIKTLAKEAAIAKAGELSEPSAPRKPGRPKGSKNKKSKEQGSASTKRSSNRPKKVG